MKDWPQDNSAAPVVVVGAGRLGSRLLDSLREDPLPGVDPAHILATTQSAASAQRLLDRGWSARPFDLAKASTGDFRATLGRARAAVFCAAPRREEDRRGVYAVGPARMVEALPPSAHLVFVSSTGVYAEDGGGEVDEDAPTSTAARAQNLLAGERAARSVGATVLRASGLVDFELGPQRRSLRGEQADRWLNLVWVDDVVEALRWALATRRGGVFNVSGPAQRRREFYAALTSPSDEDGVTWFDGASQGYRICGERYRLASENCPRRVRGDELHRTQEDEAREATEREE